jgi:predicted signal transduction protein with EAL and GGDEF domain
VVAEGIEHQVQRQLLWQMGCRLGQGHLFAPAVAADQLLARLTRGTGERAGYLAAPLADGNKIVQLRDSRRKGTSTS